MAFESSPTATPRRPRTLWIVIGVLVLIGIWLFSGYNGLLSSKLNVDTSWSQIQSQYQRRFDLVPNLVNTVKGAANFEQQTLTNVTEARTKWMNAGGNRDEQIAAAGQFDSALSRLLVTVEAYPQLQATQAYRDFMTQLEGTENRVNTARMDYNTAVRDYNFKVQRFPTNIIAGLFGHRPEKFFESTQGADQAPKVDFTE